MSGQWIPMKIRYEGQSNGEAAQLEFEFRKAEINTSIRTHFPFQNLYTYVRNCCWYYWRWFVGKSMDKMLVLVWRHNENNSSIFIESMGYFKKINFQKADALESLEDVVFED